MFDLSLRHMVVILRMPARSWMTPWCWLVSLRRPASLWLVTARPPGLSLVEDRGERSRLPGIPWSLATPGPPMSTTPWWVIPIPRNKLYRRKNKYRILPFTQKICILLQKHLLKVQIYHITNLCYDLTFFFGSAPHNICPSKTNWSES